MPNSRSMARRRASSTSRYATRASAAISRAPPKKPSGRIGASGVSTSPAGGTGVKSDIRESLLEQPGEPPVLQQLALRLARRAVAHHVVLVEHGLELVAAARAGLAVAPMDGERHRQLVGDRERQGRLVVGDRVAEQPDRGV